MSREKMIEEEEGFDSLYEEGQLEKLGMHIASEDELEEEDEELLEQFANANGRAISQNLSEAMERIRARSSVTEQELAAAMAQETPEGLENPKPQLLRTRVEELEDQFSQMLVMFRALMVITQGALQRVQQLEDEK